MSKCPVCDKTPQPVGPFNDPGVSPCLSRCDHVHEGVHQLIAGANITLVPANGKGDVEVSAPAPNNLAWMAVNISRTVVAGDGDEEFTCLSEDDGAPFTPKHADLLLYNDETNKAGSSGRAIMTDGVTLVDQGCMYCYLTTTAAADRAVFGFVFTVANRYLVTHIAATSAVKFKIHWSTIGAAGLACHGILKISGVKT